MYKADLVVLALGFLGPDRQVMEQLQAQLDHRGKVSTMTSKYNTSIPRLYAAGGWNVFFTM